MSEFSVYFQIGLKHVLDIRGYDHILFLIALVVPFALKDWRRILLLVTIFTAGHTLALILSVFSIVTIKAQLVEFLIPLTILITSLFNLFSADKPSKNNSTNVMGTVTLFFGIIHGLGFASYFKPLLSGSPADKFAPMFDFALGIETAQIIVVIMILLISYVLHFFRVPRRDFVLVISAFVIGVILSAIVQNEIWKTSLWQ